ncbi:alginate export family protein [Flavobacterium sp.]|uniref:alginate export family protein n=1 Tax=Flavobacterium sp. TaxID=239 RepID=UPI0039E3A6F0
MKKMILFPLLLMATLAVAQQYPNFKPLRYDENYAVLQNDTVHNDWYKTMKFVSLSATRKTYLSFGGDIRFQYFYAKNENWGDEPKDADGYVLSRYLLHADFHAGSHFRAFVQLQSSNADGRNNPSPVDQNPLELHQAFADLAFGADQNRLLLRIGRQELAYGSQRLIAVREGPNNRQSFDAIKLSGSKGRYTADLFYSHYVLAEDGIFDDTSNDQKQFWGGYLVINQFPLFKNADLYYLGYQRAHATFNDGSGKELRHSVGLRLWGKSGNWRYDGEAVYQFGGFGTQNIKAWTASLNAGYRFEQLWLHPEIGLKGEAISGDKNAGDQTLGTFNPLFPRGAYFGLAAVIGPSNLVDAHPSVNFELSKTIDWIIDYDLFWRYSSNDGIYAPNVSLIYPGDTTTSKEIGRQLETEIIWQPNPYLYFRVEATWFEAGDYLQASGAGKNIFFAGATAQLRF